MVDGPPLPRERFSPLADCGLSLPWRSATIQCRQTGGADARRRRDRPMSKRRLVPTRVSETGSVLCVSQRNRLRANPMGLVRNLDFTPQYADDCSTNVSQERINRRFAFTVELPPPSATT